jgi:hypothetical protein
MSLDGSKVRWLSVGGIGFREVRRLLPEGTSLEKFRKMCNLKECKSAFPFELLEEDQAFLDAKELPPRAEQWSSLLGGIPDQETVDEARRLFDELQCPDVRSYLTHYLRQDVLMLGKGFKALRDSFYDLFGLDLVDSRKFTISSLSALASQAHLFRQKSVGMFSPQCPKIYSVLRKGLRGGQYTHICSIVASAQQKADQTRPPRLPLLPNLLLLRRTDRGVQDGRGQGRGPVGLCPAGEGAPARLFLLLLLLSPGRGGGGGDRRRDRVASEEAERPLAPREGPEERRLRELLGHCRLVLALG